MLHRAKFAEYHGSTTPHMQMGTFIRQCNLTRENIINVQEMPNGEIILFYWQDLYR